MTASLIRHAPMTASSAERVAARPTQRHQLIEAETPAVRAELEAFIAHRYARAYNATIRHFLPRLYALIDDDVNLLAAFGLRDASSESLFLETYLDHPIERLIGEQRDIQVSRHEIVEIGNLAGRQKGALRMLIGQLGVLLQSMGYRWLVFTGNPQLVNGFTRLGIDVMELAPARIERLPEDCRTDWGTYYDGGPIVVCADITAGRAHLAAHPELLRQALPPTVSGGEA